MSVGSINFGVGIDASGLATELQRHLDPAIAIAQRKLDQKPLKIKFEIEDLERQLAPAVAIAQQKLNQTPLKVKINVDVDTSVAATEIAALATDHAAKIKVDIDVDAGKLASLAAVQALADKDVRVRVNLDLSEAEAQRIRDLGPALRNIRTLSDKDVRVRVNVDFTQADADKLKAVGPALRALRTATDKNIRIRVNLDMSEAELERLKAIASALRSLRGLTDKNIRIRIDIDVDEARLAQIAAALRGLRDTNVRVSANVDGESRVNRLGDSLGSLGKWVGIGAAITAGLAAIGGAAGAAAGAIGGLGAGLVALGPAAAAIGATAFVGLKGIKDAFTALGNSSQNAATESKAHAKAVASASNAVESALLGATSAQRGLNSAQKTASQAALDVGKAYREAEKDLANYQLTLHEASLSEREAQLNLAEAQQELVTAQQQSDPLVRERALLRVERAEIDLTKAQQANVDLQAQAADAQKKGVEGSDKVVAAKAKQADADEKVVEALAAVTAANKQVTQAQQALTDAQNEGTPSAQKLAEAMANLSPNAQAFVTAFHDLSPALTEFRMAVQDTLFADLAGEMKLTADTILPALKQGMNSVAVELNGMAKQAGEFLRSASGMQLLNDSFANGAALLHGMRTGTGEFTQGIVDATSAAKPVMDELGKSIASIVEGIGRAFSQSAKSGELTSVISGLSEAFRGLGTLLEGVVSSFLTIGNAVLPALKPFFETLGGALKEIAPSLGQLGKVFVESLTAILPQLAILIRALAEGLKPVLPVVANLLIAIGKAIEPLIGPFSQIAVLIGNTLVDTIKALEPALGPLAKAFADILTAVAPLVPLFAQSLSTVLVALAPAISDIAKALAPVIKMFADEMTPVIKELAPILAQAASTLGLALADALREIAPLLPDLVSSFGELVIAIVPLLPTLVDLAVTFLPPVISIMKDMIPILTDMIDAFTWFVNNVLIPYVIPALQMMADTWRNTFDQIATAVHFFTDTILPKIAESLTNIKNEFSAAVEWIGNVWSKLGDVLAIPINFVITTVLNNGLFKAWNSVGDLLGGALPHVGPLAEIPHKATGGPSIGKGTGTSDEILTWLSNGEHVVTAAEVLKAGGQNILFAIRDMISRGIPFTWDNGQIITDLGRGNLDAYGAAVAAKGIGNVPPEGLFSQLLPKFKTGGPVEPWMLQLQKGHEFARAQNGKPYKWAGPQFQGDSFDCSGFMGSIAAAILGTNPWQRYWSTGSFNGQQVGPQGFTHNALDGGMVVGISNGGEGGGHTAGVLGALDELGIAAARVESGGSIGDVHYGRGTDPRSFQMMYGLPIGANGFFQPGEGGGSVGPSTETQLNFIGKTIRTMMDAQVGPVRALIKSVIGDPPPPTRSIPPSFLDRSETAMSKFLQDQAGNLGGAIGGVWQRATDLGSSVLSAINPFDSGGIASGTGVMTKNVIEPERILSPEQTRLFDALVTSLQSIAGSPSATVPDLLTGSVFQTGIDFLTKTLVGMSQKTADAIAIDQTKPLVQDTSQTTAIQAAIDEVGKIVMTTQDLVLRTSTSSELAIETQAQQVQAGMDQLAEMLTDQALIPIMQSAVQEGIGILRKWLDAGADQVTAGTDRTTSAVLSTGGSSGGGGSAPFGAAGSAFDAVSAISSAIVGVANTARQAFESVANSIAQAALAQTPSKADPSKGKLGTDISGGPLVDTLVRLTGVEIDIRQTLIDTLDEIVKFRGDLHTAFDESGRIVGDTAELMQRNESSRELVISETERINKALIKALLKYLVLNVLLPIIQAILGAMITLATTAIGAAIGSFIPIIGTAIGAAIGAVIGAALAGLAAVFTSALAVGAGAALDAFDSGGVATGVGFMPKNTIAPERVLSPRQTDSFDRLVNVLDRADMGRNVTIHAPFTVLGGAGAGRNAHSDLLSLINN